MNLLIDFNARISQLRIYICITYRHIVIKTLVLIVHKCTRKIHIDYEHQYHVPSTFSLFRNKNV